MCSRMTLARGLFNLRFAIRSLLSADGYYDALVYQTSCIENYWSLLKRGIKGADVSVEPFHLIRYLNKQSFRLNTRKDKDQGRVMKAVSSVSGKRIQYKQLIGQAAGL